MKAAAGKGNPEELSISVIMPVFNGGVDFRSCLDAVRENDSRHLEIIVVDDGSTDNTAAHAGALGCRVFSTDGSQSGPAKARNIGAEHATGEILLFVDSDVVIMPGSLAKIASAFRSEPSLDALFGSYDDHPGAPNFLSQYKNLLHHYVHQHGNSEAATFWSGFGAVRRDVFLRHGGFNDRRYPRPSLEDIDLGYRIKKGGGRIKLDKSLQATHLKRWTASTLLISDIFDRAIPWGRLAVEHRPVPRDLNLDRTSTYSVLSAWLLAASLPAAVSFPPARLTGLAGALLLIILNRDLYRWFADRRGPGFAVAAALWHWLYLLYGSAAFATGAAIQQASSFLAVLAGRLDRTET